MKIHDTISIILCAIAAAVLTFIAMGMSGCASIFYKDGTARIMGDYTYQRSAKGDVTITLNHSRVIDATTKTVTAAGAAATSLVLSAP